MLHLLGYDHATAGYTQCQWLSITDQLNNGIRFLDIRCTYEVNGQLFGITHGGYDQNITFADVQQEVIAFLNANPTEFVLMNVQQEYSDNPNSDFVARFQSLVTGFDHYWFFDQRIPTVREARKHIVLIRAYDQQTFNAQTGKGGWLSNDGLPWNGFDINSTSQNAFFETQNAWNAWESDKVAAIKTLLSGSAYQTGRIVLNFLSYAHGGATPGRNAEAMNPEILKYIQTLPETHCLGVLPMDFATNTPGFIEAIIRHNSFPTGAALVRILYHEVMGREPDPQGLAYYTAALSKGWSSSQVRSDLARSDESRKNLQALYRRYLFRDADPAVIDSDVNLLASGSVTFAQIEDALRNGTIITVGP
jgi:1-phosphatidylinositol phosphodiesterase